MVPEGWEDATLGDLVKLQRGHDLPAHSRADGDIEVIGGGGPNGYHNVAKAPAPGIVIGRSGSGIGNAWWSDKPFWPLNTGMYVTDFLGNDPRFCFLWLDWIDFTSHNSGGAQPSLNRNFIYPIPLPIPPLPEQRKIAEILSTWDRAIETAQALLATARTQKRALMQTLLTGKRRFPEFEGQEWKEVRLGDVLEISAGKAKRDVLDEGGDKVVLDMGSVSRSGTVIPKKRTFSNDDVLSVGDLVMPKDDIGGGNIIGKVVRVSAENAFVLGDHVYRLRIKPNQEVNSGFLRFVINGPEVNRWFRRKANGTAQLGLGRKEVEKQVVSLPGMDEQNRISEVLSEAETLEADYEAEIEKLRTEKKALMQQLLTGKRRVRV